MADYDLIPVSWDGNNINDSTNYESGFSPGIEWGLPEVGVRSVIRTGRWPAFSGVERPGRVLELAIVITASNKRTARDNLLTWFDPEDETTKKLIVEDEDGTGDRYVWAVCEALEPMVSTTASRDGFRARLRVDGDVRWRETSATTDSWSITATGQTKALTNNGTDDAYPKLTIEPTAAKSGAGGGSYIYRRFISIRWRIDESASSYPVDIVNDGLDTDALVETATSTTLNGAFNAGATTCTLTDASSFPSAGMAYITDGVTSNEQISWTGKSSNDLTGCTRGIGGTSDVNHSGGQTIKHSKMLANGADVRVEVDGSEVDRWLQDFDNATTQIWANLDFSAKWEGTITSAIGSGDTVTSIVVNEATDDAPGSGILMINSEAFVYSAKDDATKTFTISSRAAHGTSAGTHAADDTIWWCQHSVYIKYGNQGASAPSTDDDYEPAFELSSTNTSWVFQEFGEDDGLRTGAWTFQTLNKTPTAYGGNQDSTADPWVEIGMKVDEYSERGRWRLYNPCGMTNANFTNGEQWSEDTSYWKAYIKSGDSERTEDTIAAPSSASTWESWSDNEALTSGSTWVALELLAFQKNREHKLECADCTVTLNSSNTPTLTVGSEQGGSSGYELACTITNNTTGKAIELSYLMDVDDDLEVDTDARTVTDLGDSSSQFQALTLTGGARRDWLKLQPGSNTIQFDDVGTTGVDIDFSWEERFY